MCGWSRLGADPVGTDEVGAAERPSVQGLSDLTMNAAGALGGVVAGVVVLTSSYGALCAVALVPVAVLGVAVRFQTKNKGDILSCRYSKLIPSDESLLFVGSITSLSGAQNGLFIRTNANGKVFMRGVGTVLDTLPTTYR